jgi:uncharacterized RDD family membrane protein YckC
MVNWAGGRVTVEDSVASTRRLSGRALRDAFFLDMPPLTLGLIQARGSSLYLGPLEVIRFGPAKSTRTSVDLPIEGGLAVGAAGGTLRIEAVKGALRATVEGYRPRVPLPIYIFTQLPLHHLIMRMHLLRERGRLPTPGIPAAPAGRFAGAAIDTALCAALAMSAGKGRRLPALVGITAAYHIAAWSIFGRTLGGLVTKQRVVAVDGSRVSIGQSLVRLLALPLAALRLRAVHDEIAGTEVIAD